jgi:REP element-mobilizing transposase RayT
MQSSRLREIQQCAAKAAVKIAAVEQHKRHIHIILENGRKVFTAITPSDKRASLNLVRDLKREGATA